MLEPSNNSELAPIPNKRYFTIGEVSELCAVKPHVLRYWEQEFPDLKPVKRRGNPEHEPRQPRRRPALWQLDRREQTREHSHEQPPDEGHTRGECEQRSGPWVMSDCRPGQRKRRQYAPAGGQKPATGRRAMRHADGSRRGGETGDAEPGSEQHAMTPFAVEG